MALFPKVSVTAVHLVLVCAIATAGITIHSKRSGTEATFSVANPIPIPKYSLESSEDQVNNKKISGVIADSSTVTFADVTIAISEICAPNNIVTGPNGAAMGCRTCPKGSVFQDEQSMHWDLKRALSGHFTSSDEENIILSVNGCEPHSMNFGGTFVFLRDNSKLKLLSYNGSLITERCHKLRSPDGRDFLVCQGEWGGQGSVASFIYQVVFDGKGASKTIPIFETSDSMLTCGKDLRGKPDSPVQKSEIRTVQFKEHGSKLSGLSVSVTLGKKQLTQAEKVACVESVKNSNYQEASVSIPTKVYRIDFSYDGREFKIVPLSATTLKLFPKPELPK
ncbi:MAG: hypothetical protein ACHQ1H_10625 [Nitrososphaerales archaeon]